MSYQISSSKSSGEFLESSRVLGTQYLIAAEAEQLSIVSLKFKTEKGNHDSI